MIDLTNKGLPNVITIDGKPFSIFTDFRVWMKFEISVVHSKLEGGSQVEIGYLFKNERPTFCNIEDFIRVFKTEKRPST